MFEKEPVDEHRIKLILSIGPRGLDEKVGIKFLPIEGDHNPDLIGATMSGGSCLVFSLDEAMIDPKFQKLIKGDGFIEKYGNYYFLVNLGAGDSVTIASMIDEAESMIPLAYQLQNDDTLTAEDRDGRLNDLREKYRAWYRYSLAILAQAGRIDLQEPFRKEYEGNGFFNGLKIAKFLHYGPKDNPISKGKPMAAVESSFIDPIRRQCDLLAATGGA